MKRDAQQPTLTSRENPAADVEEWRRLQHAVLDDSDATGLLDDEDPAVIQRLGEKNRSSETGGDERIELESEPGR